MSEVDKLLKCFTCILGVINYDRQITIAIESLRNAKFDEYDMYLDSAIHYLDSLVESGCIDKETAERQKKVLSNYKGKYKTEHKEKIVQSLIFDSDIISTLAPKTARICVLGKT